MESIILCVKQVPNTANVKLDTKNHTLIRKGISQSLNPFDGYALNAALECKNKYNSKIIVVTMGPKNSKETLKSCLDKGADEAFLINDPLLAGSDTLATSIVLAEFIKRFSCPCIFCGQESTDSSTGHIGPAIAELLNLPQIPYAESLIDLNKNKLKVKRRGMSEDIIIDVEIPVIISFISYRKEIINKFHDKGNKKIEILDLKSLKLDSKFVGLEGSPTRVTDIEINDDALSFFKVDSNLPARERLLNIMRGGITTKKDRKIYREKIDTGIEDIIDLVDNYK